MNITCIEAKTFTKKQIMNNHKAMIIREKYETYISELKRIKQVLDIIDFESLDYTKDKHIFIKATVKSVKIKK